MAWIERHGTASGSGTERILAELERLVRGEHADAAMAASCLPLLHPWAAGGNLPRPAISRPDGRGSRSSSAPGAADGPGER